MIKQGKPFAVFSKLTEDDSLSKTWKVASRIANEIEHGHRIENLSWRLWHLRDVLVSSEVCFYYSLQHCTLRC